MMKTIGVGICFVWTAVWFIGIPVIQARRRSVWSETNFNGESDSVQTRISEYGEKETRISTDGIRAMETTEPHFGEDFLFVKEAAKNDRLIWLAYMDRDHIIDCNITTDTHELEKFERKFNNGTVRELSKEKRNKKQTEKHSQITDFLDFRSLLKECRSFKKKIHEIRKEHNRERHQHQKPKHLKHEPDSDSEEDESETIKSRSKRSVFSMMYPGTKWCGAGNRATEGYEDLGESAATDQCCREHDHCPYTISGFSQDYNIFNYKFHTLSHCNCEDKFKSCLKAAGSSVANMIGYLYFNYVGTQCFNLKPKKICKKRTWWGKCRRYQTKYSAKLQDSDITF